MGVKIERVSERCLLGEGPHWDAEKQTLYYVDAFVSKIHRYVPATKENTVVTLDDNKAVVSIVIPLKGQKDKFVATIDRKLVIMTWDGVSSQPQNVETIFEEPKEKVNFNDGKVDPTGRLWVGSLGKRDKGVFPEGAGRLFSIGKDRKGQQHLDNITIANGLAWSHDLKHMYYIDTPTKRVDVLDFDAKTGNISNRRTCFDLSTSDLKPILEGSDFGPDGMTIDTDGNLWVAVFNAGCVININPNTAKLIRKVDIPTSPQITSVAFGGKDLDELYVVSASVDLTPEQEAKYPDVGCTFRITGLGVKGLAGLPAQF